MTSIRFSGDFEPEVLFKDGLFGVLFPDGKTEMWQRRDESESWFLHRVQQHWQGLQWVGETDGMTIGGGRP